MKAQKKIAYAIIACTLVALLSWGFAVFSTLFGPNHTSSGSSGLTEEVAKGTTEAPAGDFAEHGLIITEDFTISLKGYKIIEAGEPGNLYETMPVIGFWYDVTNHSDKEISPSNAWIYCVTAIQDNDENRQNELNTAAIPDERFQETQSEPIKQGGTVSCAVAYVLTDTVTPVTLRASNGVIGEELGERTFSVMTGSSN